MIHACTIQLPKTEGQCSLHIGRYLFDVFKVEWVSRDPEIIIFHDFVSDSESTGLVDENFSKV
jgi:hypothetical protein